MWHSTVLYLLVFVDIRLYSTAKQWWSLISTCYDHIRQQAIPTQKCKAQSQWISLTKTTWVCHVLVVSLFMACGLVSGDGWLASVIPIAWCNVSTPTTSRGIAWDRKTQSSQTSIIKTEHSIRKTGLARAIEWMSRVQKWTLETHGTSKDIQYQRAIIITFSAYISTYYHTWLVRVVSCPLTAAAVSSSLWEGPLKRSCPEELSVGGRERRSCWASCSWVSSSDVAWSRSSTAVCVCVCV